MSVLSIADLVPSIFSPKFRLKKKKKKASAFQLAAKRTAPQQNVPQGTSEVCRECREGLGADVTRRKHTAPSGGNDPRLPKPPGCCRKSCPDASGPPRAG